MLKPHDATGVASEEHDGDAGTVHHAALIIFVHRLKVDGTLSLLRTDEEERAVELAGGLEVVEESAEAAVGHGEGVLEGAVGERAVGVGVAAFGLSPGDCLGVGAEEGGSTFGAFGTVGEVAISPVAEGRPYGR